MPDELSLLLADIRRCTICQDLPLGPRPIVQADINSRILIAGQAPGRITHAKGRPFDDPSGKRLREWLGVSEAQFYNPSIFAVAPMGFCFPGTGKGGDLAPRVECAPAWRSKLLDRLPNIELTLVIGSYARNWHLPGTRGTTLTKTVQCWREYWPDILPLPHPSPRNNRWLKKNTWFEKDIIPALQNRVQDIIKKSP